MNRLLFITHRRAYSWGQNHRSSGLTNSVRFVVDMLMVNGIEAAVVDVDDSNSIDREVARYRPTHVILEAIWCPPAKIVELRKIHRRVHWICRLHSHVPFLAHEGMAIEWLIKYMHAHVEIMCNSALTASDVRTIGTRQIGEERLHERVSLGPNYYPIGEFVGPRRRRDNHVDIGCFGAIRPLKNQLAQAVAALDFAWQAKVHLRFHINSMRIEGKGDPVLKNLAALLGGQLVCHPWMSHAEFLELMRSMDISLQVSLSETFNIVTADAVVSSIPVVVSPQISWLGDYAIADPSDTKNITGKIWGAWTDHLHHRAHEQRGDLHRFNLHAENTWVHRFRQDL
jgi:hypothetical protein